MQQVLVDLNQDSEITLRIPQGYDSVVGFDWFEPDGITPIDLTGFTFFAQIRTNIIDDGGVILQTITTVPNANGDVLMPSVLLGTIDCKFSEVTSRSLDHENTYYFELKISAAGRAVEGIKGIIQTVAEIAKL